MPLGMLGKYERLDVLGHGVSGIVYLAKDTLLNKQVALKVVDVQSGDLPRFLAEARVMDRLRHPNIVRVNGVDRIEGQVVIDMEYIRGENLQDLLRKEGRLPLDRALGIAADVLDALDYAHRMQTVHRDIKPANILITRDGEVKLVDFGLAEILATNAYAGGAGTYAYMAPEDFAEEDRSDSQSDIWAVGVTLYEMVTGQRPFQVSRMKDPFSWKRVLENEAPAPLRDYWPEAPDALQKVLDRALARAKSARYAAAGEFRDELLRLRAGEPLSALTLEAAEETSARRERMSRAAAREGASPTVPLTPALWDHPPRAAPAAAPIVPPITPAAPGMVVAEARPLPDASGGIRSRSRSLFRRNRDAQLLLEPDAIDFGEARKGEMVSARVTARAVGIEGPTEGRITALPPWITAHPMQFDRARQTITLTAHSSRVWETGEFRDIVQIETAAGSAETSVRLKVRPPRSSFVQVAFWFVPCLIGTLLPVLAVAFSSAGALSSAPRALIPAASLATAILALMMLLVAVSADLGIAERSACGSILAVMCLVLGASASAATRSSEASAALQHSLFSAGLLVGPLLLQVASMRRWKLWAFVALALGSAMGAVFFQFLTRG